ncbi:MAG: matrixin family metalloprotease [Bacteroidetes bacterium]|nr:matrixin family metalloprotease [Bacteroidota bacterium]
MKYYFLKTVAILFAINLISCSDNEPKENAIEQQKVELIKTAAAITPATINIQPYDGLDEEITNYIFAELNKVYPKVKLLAYNPLPQRAYYKPRNRYKADTILAILNNTTANGEHTVALTNKDISSDNGPGVPDWGIMGLALIKGKPWVASTFRVSKTNVKQQYFKVVIHELGHTQGLKHCPDKTCIMTDAEGKNNTENEKGFCKKCEAVLKAKGFIVDKFIFN